MVVVDVIRPVQVVLKHGKSSRVNHVVRLNALNVTPKLSHLYLILVRTSSKYWALAIYFTNIYIRFECSKPI